MYWKCSTILYKSTQSAAPRDGEYVCQSARKMKDLARKSLTSHVRGLARPNHLGSHHRHPDFPWGGAFLPYPRPNLGEEFVLLAFRPLGSGFEATSPFFRLAEGSEVTRDL